MAKKLLVIFGASIAVLSLAVVIGLFFWKYFPTGKPLSGKKVYLVGLLQMAPTVAGNMNGFKIGMRELGFEEGVNIKYEYRDANGDLKKLKEYAKELVALKPDMIFVNTSPGTAAAKEATKGTGIPVVFSVVADPLGAGFVKSIKSSGNNLTGTSCDYIDIAPKRLALLKEIDPAIKNVLVFYRPEDKSGAPATKKILAAASSLGLRIIAVPIEAKSDIKNYLENIKEGDVDAIMDPADSMVTAGLMEWGIKKTRELKIPLFSLSKEECQKGALASFGVDYVDLGEQSALIANQVLSGILPSDIPIESPRKFLFAINLKTAKKIGLSIPKQILQEADLIIK